MTKTTSENLLDSYRVLDLTDERGLRCGSLLGGLGADVIQVEPPGGNPARKIGPFYHDNVDPEKSLYWFANCSDKKSITLNVETEAGQGIFMRLARKADFVIESMSPGYLDGLGLGYAALRDLNPGLVMTSITPYGTTGPYKDYKTSDIVAMGMGGIMSVCGDADRAPLRVSVDQAFTVASAHAAGASLVAHRFRRLTGEGQYVDCSVHESIAWLVMVELAMWQWAGIDSHRNGARRSRTRFPTLSVYPCEDGQVAFWLIYGAYGRRIPPLVEWMDGEGMAGPLKEVPDWTKVDASKITLEQQTCWEETFAAFLKRHTKAELYKEALKRGFILCPSNTISDLTKSAQLEARGFWEKVHHPDIDAALIYAGDPYQFSAISRRTRKPAPRVGEHNEEIYCGELGFTKQQLADLQRAGII